MAGFSHTSLVLVGKRPGQSYHVLSQRSAEGHLLRPTANHSAQDRRNANDIHGPTLLWKMCKSIAARSQAARVAADSRVDNVIAANAVNITCPGRDVNVRRNHVPAG